MKLTLLLLSLPLLVLATPTPPPAYAPEHNKAVPPDGVGRYNVIIGNDDPRTLDELIAEFGLNRSDLQYVFDNPAFRGFSGDLSGAQVSALSTTSGYAAFEPEKEIEMHEFVPGTWGHKRISQKGKVNIGGKNLVGLDFENYVFDGPAQDLGKDVDIYILDSGVNFEHQEFGGRAFYTHSFDDELKDDVGHGTAVAGIAGSAAYGVAKGANIIALRVGGKNERPSSNKMINGISSMVTRHTARRAEVDFRGSVATMSLGGSFISTALEEAVAQASAVGIHFVVSAGNRADDACNYSPGRLSFGSNIVTVGSINVKDQRSFFSNYGPCVAVYAPGEKIVTTGPNYPTESVVVSGTSHAVPHVSGLMAVFLSMDETLKTAPGMMKTKIIDLALIFELDQLQLDSLDSGLLLYNGKEQRA